MSSPVPLRSADSALLSSTSFYYNTGIFMFSRQEIIEGWQQQALAQTRCLCLGIGALGSHVAIQLARLGVGSITMVDNDVVEESNLNRQNLFSKEQVGQSKAQAAATQMLSHCVGTTKVQTLHLDAVHQFGEVVRLAQENDVIFNMIDYGDSYDYLMQALAKQLQKALIQGGTFSHSCTVDLVLPWDPVCLLCMNPSKAEYLQLISPAKSQHLEEVSWLPRNENPPSQSNVFLAGICAGLMVALFTHKAVFRQEEQRINRVLLYVNDMQMLTYAMEREEDCLFCQGQSE